MYVARVVLSFFDREDYFNFINATNPDVSGMLRFLTDELQDAEDAGDRGMLASSSSQRFRVNNFIIL